MYIRHVWGHICALFVVRVVDQKMQPNLGLCVTLSVCFHKWKDVEDAGRVQAAE